MEVIENEVYKYRQGRNKPDINLDHTKIVEIDGKRTMVFGDIGDAMPNYVPSHLVKCYKVVKKYSDSSYHPLFAGIINGWRTGDRIFAEGYSSSNDRGHGTGRHITPPRYALHGGVFVPTAPQIMKPIDIEHSLIGSFDGEGNDREGHKKYNEQKVPKSVVIEMWMDISADYTNVIHELAKKKRTWNREHKDEKVDTDNGILGLMPFGGSYVFMESNLSMWICSSMGIVGKELSEAERQNILTKQGIDEQKIFRTGKLPAMQKAEISRALRNNNLTRAMNIQKMYQKNINECIENGWSVPENIFEVNASERVADTGTFFYTNIDDFDKAMSFIQKIKNFNSRELENIERLTYNRQHDCNISSNDWSYYKFMNDLSGNWKKVQEYQREIYKHIIPTKYVYAELCKSR